jgi:tRNA pseudouridine55 synthase
MDGILLVDKPEGWTSHDVVAKVRGILKAGAGKKIKVGHTGTLDPAATGLLVLVLGRYTKRAGEFSKLDKVYEAELTLGAVSTTGEKEGEVTQKSTQKPAEKAVQAVLSTFLG